MARWKSVFDKETQTLKQVPADNAARLEVLKKDLHEGAVSKEEFNKKASALIKVIEDEKAADKKSADALTVKQTKEREAVLKVSADKKKAVAAAAKARSSEKAKRKEGK